MIVENPTIRFLKKPDGTLTLQYAQKVVSGFNFADDSPYGGNALTWIDVPIVEEDKP